MSKKYDLYLAEHISRVQTGLRWIIDHVDLKTLGLTDFDISSALDYAIIHDESKTSKEEYDAYDKYFYGENRSYAVVQNFNYAWLHHIHNNPHHWQYWILMEDDPEKGQPSKALEMPACFVLEMIADWWTFSWRSGNLEEIFSWYDAHRNTIMLHKNTEALVQKILDELHKAILQQGGDDNGKAGEKSAL